MKRGLELFYSLNSWNILWLFQVLKMTVQQSALGDETNILLQFYNSARILGKTFRQSSWFSHKVFFYQKSSLLTLNKWFIQLLFSYAFRLTVDRAIINVYNVMVLIH